MNITHGTESKSVSNICITDGCSPVMAIVDNNEDGCYKRKEHQHPGALSFSGSDSTL